MDFASLLGESVSKEVVQQLEEGLATTIKNAVHAKEQELMEKADAYAQYLKNEYSEKADEYGSYVRDKMIADANAYGEHLQEKFAEKEVEYLERIDFIKSAAEDYAELVFNDIVEKADSYTEQFVEEYKAENVEMFEAIQRETNARDIVENITAALASFGFDTDQNSAIRQLEESVASRNAEIKSLQSKLFENDVSKQKELVLERMTKGLSLSEKQKVIDAASDILTESVSGFESVVRVLVNKYDSNDDNNVVEKTTKKINERVNTSNINESVSFKGTFTSNPTVDDIANTLI